MKINLSRFFRLRGRSTAHLFMGMSISSNYVSRRVVVWSGVLAALVLSGCYRQWVSIGSMPADSGWHSEQHVAHSRLEGSELKLYVGTANVSRSWDPGKREFSLSVRFYPKKTGFRFNPQQVRLVLSGAMEVAPGRIEMIEDVMGWESAWQCRPGSRTWASSSKPAHDYDVEKRMEEQGKVFSLNREACFEFYFPIQPPSPETLFGLRIRGLSHDGKLVKVPDINFRKGSFWVWDFLGR